MSVEDTHVTGEEGGVVYLDRDEPRTRNMSRGEKWVSQIKDFLKYRHRFDGFWVTVDANYRQAGYEPKNRSRAREELEQVFPGRVYRLVHNTEAAVYSTNLKVYLDGYYGTFNEDLRDGIERALNTEWSTESGLSRDIRLAIRDCCKYGMGIVLNSYEGDLSTAVDDAAAAEEAKNLEADNPVLASLQTSIDTQVGVMAAHRAEPVKPETFEHDASLLKGNIATRRISPWHFLIDPYATSLDDARWCGRIIFADLASVQADENLKKTKKLKKATYREYLQLLGQDSTTSQSPSNVYDMTILFELFVKEPGGKWRLLVLSQEGDILREEESPYYLGNPYEMLSWNEDGECIFAQSDILPVYSEIIAERILLTKAVDGYSRQQLDTIIYDKAANITEESMDALVRPDVARFIAASGVNGQAVQNSFYKIPTDAKSPELLNFMGALERSIQSSAGISPNQVGQALKSGTTATEASSIAQYANAALAYKQAATEIFVGRVASKRLQLMAQFYKSDRIARLCGPEAAATWASWKKTPGEVQNLRVCVRPGTMRPVNDDVRAQQYSSILQTALKFPVFGSLLDMPMLIKGLFHSMGLREGHGLIQEKDAEAVSQALQMQAVAQMQGGGGGSPPGESAPPSGEAGAAQMGEM